MRAVAVAVLVAPHLAWANDVVVKREYVDGPFGQIHLRLARPSDLERETQPPLALFHYSPGSSPMYANLIPLSAADRLVMAFDTPGYGNSSAPPEQPSITDYSEALADAAEQLTVGQPIDIFGHLTRSLIAVEMAIARSDLIHRVVLSRSPGFSDEFSTGRISIFQQFHAQQQADSTGQDLVESLETRLANRDPSESPERGIGIYIDSLLPGRNWSYGEMPPFSYRADVQIPRIFQPTLYLNWTWD